MTDLISRRAVLDRLKMLRRNYTLKAGYRDAMTDAIGEVRDTPAIDAVPVVRCKDCKYWKPCHSENRKFCVAIGYGYMTNPDGYCHMGARMDGESEEER